MEATGFGIFVLIVFVLIVFANSVKVVPQAHEWIIERLGRYSRTLNPGLSVIIPFVDRVRARVDMREQVLDHPPQQVITKDNVGIKIDAVMYYQVMDSFRAVYEIANTVMGIEKLTVTTLRNVVGDLELDQTLVSRDRINTMLREILDTATDKWGVKVNRVELKNIIPPPEITEAMQKQMKAEREKRAVILDAEGVKMAAIREAEGDKQARILKAEGFKQAQILEAEGKSEAIITVFNSIHEGRPTNDLIAIRYLEMMEKLADGKATKIILPAEVSGILGSIAGVAELFKEPLAASEAARESAP